MCAKIVFYVLVLVYATASGQELGNLLPAPSSIPLTGGQTIVDNLPASVINNPIWAQLRDYLDSIPNIPSLGGNTNNSNPVDEINALLNAVAALPDSLGITNVDRNIERPCHVGNLNCVREYFARHSICKKVAGEVPSPLYREQGTSFLSNINLTLTGTDIIYTGLDGVIEDFYINRETDKLVLLIQYTNVTIFSQNTFYIFHRRAKEPIVNVDYLYSNFKSLSTTTIIPDLRDLQLQKSETYTYVDDANPTRAFGPRAFVSSDPGVPATLVALEENLPTAIQEFFLTEGPFYAATNIQKKICDFGLKLL